MTRYLSASRVRAITLAAQGFGADRDGPVPGRRAILSLVRRLGLLQIDSVNVLCRAHYMPLYSRLGPYDRSWLEHFNQGPASRRRLFEYWGHEASLIPVEDYPLYRFRMQRAREGGGGLYKRLARFSREQPAFIAAALEEIRHHGALAASDLTDGGRGQGSWWGWSHGKSALEYLFWSGQVLVSHRRGNFERVYDLPERVVGRDAVEASMLSPQAAQRTLVARAASAMGVASARDMQRYFRLDGRETRARIDELVETGELVPVEVEGWSMPAWQHIKAKASRRASDASALLSPFDPLMWDRERAARVFGFHYRIEIYTPSHLRQYGYYVLPFMLAGQMVARVDLKAERTQGVLQVMAAHPESDVTIETLAPALFEELARLARFLGLSRVEMMGSGLLDRALEAACARA
ncbi:winged helix-turn-helix domain-containing protein [Kushneria sp. Sum13]|uniref:winged helix-turn-helix domain-containing protein n=1 Tax=Kushneria sp. Sum13 TaxID=3459196 RepID=UPI00404581B5